MKNTRAIMELFGEVVDMYRESQEILICESAINASSEIEELEFKCNELMYQARQLVA